MRLLMASIVDPAEDKGGAGTVTRGLLSLIRYCGPDAEVQILAPRPVHWRKGRQAFCVAGALLTSMPAKVRFHYSRSFVTRLQNLLRAKDFEFLLVNGTDLAWCLAIAPSDLPKIVVVHNTESNIYYGQLASLRNPWRLFAPLLKYDVRRLERYEISGLRQASGAIFLSEDDACYAARHLPALKSIVVPPIFPEPPSPRTKQPSAFLELGFLANLEWWPNREGLDWFLREVFPFLPRNVRLNLFGAATERLGRNDPRITGHGFVPSLSRVWEACDWMIVPIRQGSGVAVKTAECIYNGMPILTTVFGLRGLPPVDSQFVVRLDTADEWIRFLASSDAREICANRLPLSCSASYSLETNAARFNEFCRSLIAGRETVFS